MSRVVWKYPLEAPSITLRLPVDSKVVLVDMDPGGNLDWPCLWIDHELDGDQRIETTFHVHGTGHVVFDDAGARHVGSIVTPIGLVWHVYAETAAEPS